MMTVTGCVVGNRIRTGTTECPIGGSFGAYINGDLTRIERGIMRHVPAICHEKLERVLARRQLDHSFGLATAEMEMLLIVRDRLVEWRQIYVDQQMMVTGIRNERSRRRHAEVPGAKPHLKPGGMDHRAVSRPSDIDISAFRRRHAARRGGRLCG